MWLENTFGQPHLRAGRLRETASGHEPQHH